MSKTKANRHKTFENAINEQQKLVNVDHSEQVKDHVINQTHNIKKEALGPNTKR